MSDEILAATPWTTNAALIADVARLGYLQEDWPTLDPTWGKGTFWKLWRPTDLIGCDIDPAKSPIGESVDFTDLPWPAGYWRAVVFDPPYKLNGTPDGAIDGRYGVHEVRTRDQRHALMLDGVGECARVLSPGGFLHVKCKDQVNSGRVWWQTDMVTRRAEAAGLTKVDALLFMSHRPQPEGRSQQHARRNYSTLLVFSRAS